MYQYTEEQTVSMKKVEATRASRFGADIRRMTAEEKDEVLASFHPDYIASAYEELKVGPNKGGKVLHELAALLEGRPRVLDMQIDLSQPDYDVDVLIIGGGGAGASAAIEADNCGAKAMIVTKLRLGDANTAMAEGGIQAADKENDSPAVHYLDAFGGGHFKNKPELLYKLVTEAPEAIQWLNDLGVMFDKAPDGTMVTTHGGGTSRKRMHACRDYSGSEIMRVLRDEVLNRGITVVDFTSAIELIKDADGKDVTSHYEIKYVRGTLEIIQSQMALKVVANSNSWTYDDAEHSDGGYTVTYGEESYTVNAGESATLSTGDEVTAVITRKVKNVSDTADGNNEIITLTVENESQYASIIQEAGTLTITQRPVQVTVNSKTFTYDAAEHTVADEHGKEYTIETAAENSGLLLGHTESLNVVYDDGTTKTESRKYVGTYTADSERDENGKAVVTITKEDSGEDVTANYAITVKPGTLEIKKAEIEIELIGPKSERVYNGQEQVVETTEITTDEAYAHGAEEPKTIKIVAKGLKGEDYISKGTVIHIAKGTYVGEHPGDFVWDGPHGDDDKPTVLNNDGNGNAVDVTENYTFKTTPGSLTIKSNQLGEHPTQPDKEIDGHEPGTKYALGDRIYFKITVRNITLDTLELVEVYDPTAVIVPGDGYTVVDEHHAKIENMPASVDGQEPATVIINAYHVVTEDDIKNIVIDSGYKYENVATITVGDKTIDASKGTNDIEDADYTLKIEKQLINRPASGEKFKLGETAKFQITVTNEGNVTQTDIPVAEKLPGAVFTEGDGYTLNADKTVATITKVLNPADKETQHGDSIILYAQYTITENDLGNTGLKNIVTAPNGKPGEEPIPVDEAKSMAGQKIWNDLDNLYDTRTESVTVNLMRSLGRGGAAELIRTVTVTQNSGWRYSFDHLPAHDMQDNEYFYWVEEEPITGYETVYEMSDDSHCDIVNNLQTYTLTIHYWQHKLGDTKMEQAFPDYVATLYYKQPYDVESPEREGIILDDMSQARISGTMPAHDLVIDVYYHRIAYRLTIHYIYQDGTMAHEDYTWTYWFNSTYNVPSPIIPGFTPSIDVIAGRMPSHGLELTVVYVGDGEIVIPDEDTSLGFKSYLNAGECFE